MPADAEATTGTATCSLLLFLMYFTHLGSGINRPLGPHANMIDEAEMGNTGMGEETIQIQRPVVKSGEDANLEAKGT